MYEGFQIIGAQEIKEKLVSLPFEVKNRDINSIDIQLMVDGGILINVLGRMQVRNHHNYDRKNEFNYDF